MRQHLAIKLTEAGGPDPLNELHRVYKAAEDSADGTSWIATHKPGSEFRKSSDSRLLALARQSKAEALVLTAKIDAQCTEMPEDPLALDMYGDYRREMKAYWKISDVSLNCTAMADLPGKSLRGKSLSDAFSGSASFLYWQPPPHSDRHTPPERMLRRCACDSLHRRDAPAVSLHGVDFSGGTENNGHNRKLWIASWGPDHPSVSLECGADGTGFGRRELAERIIREGGLWVIDFPFGPPAAVADASGWRTWQSYLEWCNSKDDPRTLRDELREILDSACVPWSTKRMIDKQRSATWFPFFEQLYRQTITGARDVLAPLDAANRERVAVLPFHGEYEPTSRRSVVIEGFPGWTLTHMGLKSTGYKNATEEACEYRTTILNALRVSGIPIGDAQWRRAVEDSEGDAVDSLVLLKAAWSSLARDPSEWKKADGHPRKIEGGYFD